jgi:FtsP/CotA-like multicopper oxidase with cupredoxin domain
MTTGAGPYVVPFASDDDDTGAGSPQLETTLIASLAMLDIDGSGNLVNVEVFNGNIPAPTLRLNKDDSVVVRLINDLPYPTGIHWHGIELENYADGTEVTQDGVPGGVIQTLGNGVPAGGTFLYKFKVPRAGLFWYHPHHHNSLNRIFRGMYGMIIVTDPLEASIVSTPGVDRALPEATYTLPIVLSDITVCRAPGTNGPMYVDPTPLPAADRAEWLSGATAQTGPTPTNLCEIAPIGAVDTFPWATDDEGNYATVSYGANFVPSSIRPTNPGRVNTVEGQTVLTNGMNVGGRLGTPGAPAVGLVPGPPAPPTPQGVLSGGGIRLQIVNCTTLRYFRLRLTYRDGGGVGQQVPLVRVGGEGGLLDTAILEGGTNGGINTNFESGEILLPPATRADVVAAIPAGLPVGTILTLWTRDFQRIGSAARNFWPQLPTVPVMHMTVAGPKPGAPYTIVGGNLNATPPGGTALRAPAGMPAVGDLTGLATGSLLPVPAGAPAHPGAPYVDEDIKMNTAGGVPNIDTIAGMFMGSPTYAQAVHLASSRYAAPGSVLQLTVTNTSNAHHPFHLHGFSFQPVSLAPRTGAPPGITGTFTWPYREFRDTIDLPRQRTLTFRVRLDPRPLSDDVTAGGELGRWLFHCHIFFHHHQGMISEFVVMSPGGTEKPNIFVGGSWAHSPIPGSATRSGTFYHPTVGETVSLTATLQNGTSIGTLTYPTGVRQGNWQWVYNAPVGDTPRTQYVYITATDSGNRKDQAVFRLQIGGGVNPWDVGDPHVFTVDGKRYDFQAAGEFVMLRDRDGMEIQVRQTPVETPPPITDEYSGLTTCVSLNTAIAARVGSHRISYQPVEEGQEGSRYRFFLDGKPTLLTREGIDLDGHRVSAFDTAGEPGLRIDYAHNPVVIVTPLLWTSYGIRYLDVNVSNTQADEGIMGRVPKGTWLPRLPNGATVGPKPEGLLERYVALYRTFADAWRLTDQTSLFVYTAGTSTATFTDVDWPAPPIVDGREFPVTPKCVLKPGFQKPLKPILANVDLAQAQQAAQAITDEGLKKACVFDIMATGDKEFAKSYLITQEVRLNSTTVQIVGDKPQTASGQSLTVTAIVAPLSSGRPTPTGSVTFMIDGVAAGPPVTLDPGGRAAFTMKSLGIGEHMLRATYASDGTYHPSSSPNLLHTEREGGVHGTNVLRLPTIWIWVLLLLLLIVITIAVYLASR